MAGHGQQSVYLWNAPGPSSGAAERSSYPQHSSTYDQNTRGHSGMQRPDAGFFDSQPEARGFASTGEQQAGMSMPPYSSYPSGFLRHGGQVQQAAVLQMPYAQQPPPFPEPDPNIFLRSIHQPPQTPHPLQFSRFEQEIPPAAGMHAHLQPPQQFQPRPHSGQLSDDYRVYKRFHSPVGEVYSDTRDQEMDRSLMPTPTWPAPGWQQSDAYATSTALADNPRSSDGLPSNQMFAPPRNGASPLRPQQVPLSRTSTGQPSSLYNPPFPASRSAPSPSRPQMHTHGSSQGSPENAMHGHRHLAEAARSMLPPHGHPSEHPEARGLHPSASPSNTEDPSVSPDFPFNSAPKDEFAHTSAPMADACAPLPPSGAPANTFLQTIHESEGGAAVAPERKLHNQASQCSTTTSFGGGSRRFLTQNVSSISNSSIADSFRSRNSSIRSYNSSFRSVGGVSSFDFRFDSFREMPEPSDDSSEPLPPCLPNTAPTSSAAEISSSPDGRRLSAANLAAAAAADAANAADPAVNAAAAAEAIMVASGDVPSYLSEHSGGTRDCDRQFVSDMGSLTRQLDQAPSVLPAVVQVLSDTVPPLHLGLPALTKLLCNSSKRGRHARALAIFHAAPALGLAPDLPLCNAALMAAGSAGNAAASSAIFGGMIAVGINPDSVTYRASSTALAKQGHIQRTLEVLLHMLRGERVHDSTSLMAGVLSAGRRGGWAVGELMLLSSFKRRFRMSRLAALKPPAVSKVPEQFQEVYLTLCELNGITPAAAPSSLPSPEADASPTSENTPWSHAKDSHPASDHPGSDAAGAVHAPLTSTEEAQARPLEKPPLHSSPLASTPVRSPVHSLGSTDAAQLVALPCNTSAPISTDAPTPVATAAACTFANNAEKALLQATSSTGTVNTNTVGGIAASRCLLPSVACTISGEINNAVAEQAVPDDPGTSATVPDTPGSGSAPGTSGGSSSTGNGSEKAACRFDTAGMQKLPSMCHSAPMESVSWFSSPKVQECSPGQGQISTDAAVAPGAFPGGDRSMRRVVSADRVKPGQKQKRGPGAGGSSPVARSSLEDAAARAVAAVEAESADAGQSAAEPPRKRHLSPGHSAGSGGTSSSWGGPTGVSRCASLACSGTNSDGGHIGAMSPFFDSHPGEAAFTKRASSSSDASVAKLALALADARVSLTTEASQGAIPVTGGQSGQLPACGASAGIGNQDAYVASYLNSSLSQPLEAGAFSTGVGAPPGTLQPAGAPLDVEPDDVTIAAAANANTNAPAITQRLASGVSSMPGTPAQMQPASGAQVPACVHTPFSSYSSATPSASMSSVMTASGVSRGGTAREEATSSVGPGASDPLLQACFNAQLLAYSTDPTLLDRSTEILMIMLESGGEIPPDLLSFNIILRTVCATEHLQVAPALLEMMGIACVTPLVSTYAIYMAGAASAGYPWLVEHGWQAMLSAHIVPDITCIMLYLSALFQLGQCMDAATLFLRIASPPVFLAPDAATVAMILSIWMHHQLTTAGGGTPGTQHTASTQQDTFAMTSSLCRAIGEHGEIAVEATQILIEELARAGCMTAMQAALTAHQQLATSSGRVPSAQAIGQLLATLLHGRVAECAGICVGGLVRRASACILQLGGAPLVDAD